MSHSRPLTLLSLNADVLSNIIFHMSPRDAMSFSCTCRAAHTVPLEPALNTIILERDVTQIKKLRDYLSKADFRYHFLRSLTLAKAVSYEIDRDSIEAAQALADILERTPELEHFSSGAVEDLARTSGGRVLSALTSIENLRELDISGCGGDTIKSLELLRTRKLRTFTGSLYVARPSFEALMSSLAQQPHLTTLSLTLNAYVQTVQEARPKWTFPSVTSLTLENMFFPMSLAAATFPAVRHLSFRTMRPPGARPLRSELIGEPNAQCWPCTHTLDTARLDAPDLALWPLTCPVRTLELELLASGHSETAVLTVARTTPHVLTCAYRIDADNLFWVRLPTVAHSLRFLDVRVVEHYKHPKRYMLLHLANFPVLSAVDLCIRAYYIPDDTDAELSEIARTLATRNPSLRFVGLSLVDGRQMRNDEPIYDEERLQARWWAVERHEAPHLAYLTGEGDVNDEYDDGIRIAELPMGAGLRVRKFMYEADFGTQGWEEGIAALF